MSSDPTLQEYEQQLHDVEQLLLATPNDESLQSLKADLLELIAITKGSAESQPSEGTESVPSQPQESQDEPTSLDGVSNALEQAAAQAVSGAALDDDDNEKSHTQQPAKGDYSTAMNHTSSSLADPESSLQPTASLDHSSTDKTTGHKKSKKKSALTDTFQVPSHLIVQEGDSEAEIQKKRRKLKALKSQFRMAKKEAIHEQKQQSWQSFQKKKKGKRTGSSSIFSTGDAKVGVVSAGGGRRFTNVEERKRHKHS